MDLSSLSLFLFCCQLVSSVLVAIGLETTGRKHTACPSHFFMASIRDNSPLSFGFLLPLDVCLHIQHNCALMGECPILDKEARTAQTDATACRTFFQGWADIKTVFWHLLLIDCVSDRKALQRQRPLSPEICSLYDLCFYITLTLGATSHIVLSVHLTATKVDKQNKDDNNTTPPIQSRREIVKGDQEMIDMKLNPSDSIGFKHHVHFCHLCVSSHMQYFFIQSEYAPPLAGFEVQLCSRAVQ